MDQTLFHLINEQWTSPALDLFMAALSNSEIWKPVLIAIALGGLFFGGFKARAFVVCLVFSLLIAEGITSILKSAIDRHRPKQVQSVRMVELQPARPKFMTLFKKPKQHDCCSVFDVVLSASGLALLDYGGRCRLFANLSRRALAYRCDCDAVSRQRRSVAPARII